MRPHSLIIGSLYVVNFSLHVFLSVRPGQRGPVRAAHWAAPPADVGQTHVKGRARRLAHPGPGRWRLT